MYIIEYNKTDCGENITDIMIFETIEQAKTKLEKIEKAISNKIKHNDNYRISHETDYKPKDFVGGFFVEELRTSHYLKENNSWWEFYQSFCIRKTEYNNWLLEEFEEEEY